MDSAHFHSKTEYNPRSDNERDSQARPVFFDEKRTRWNGFLIFSGSALATITFLAGVIWFSVAFDPQFKPLPSYLPAADASLTASTRPVEMLSASVPEAPLATGDVPPTTADTGNAPPVAAQTDADIATTSPAPAPAPERPSDAKDPALSKMDIEAQQILHTSPSITVLNGANHENQWVSHVGLAEEVRSPGFFTLVK